MARKVVYLVAAVIVAGLGAVPARAQDSLLAELYGQGVHSYFSGRYSDAHQLLTTAIEQGSRDPRCYYFRGLTYSALGRPDEATADFKKGAELESAGGARIYPVGNSLQRIQGQNRLALESYRRSARLAARLKNVKAAQARYEELQRAEGEAIRDPTRQPAAPAADLVGPPPADSTDPFSAPPGAAVPEPAPAQTPPAAAPVTPEVEDPFGGAPPSTPPASTPPADDPFGGAADDPFGGAAPSPPSSPTPPAGDPFGGADDPFGGATPAPAPPGGAPATPPGNATPPADDPFGGTDDPFGGATPAPTPPSGAPATPPGNATPPADDPFGGATPAPTPPGGAPATPPADDPFGGADDPFGGATDPAPDPPPSGGDATEDPFADDPNDPFS